MAGFLGMCPRCDQPVRRGDAVFDANVGNCDWHHEACLVDALRERKRVRSKLVFRRARRWRRALRVIQWVCSH